MHAVTLKQVEAFYWVGTLGSFAAAADKINVAQSTISKRVQEMEMGLGVVLFDRDMRSSRLTLKGTEILALSEQMLLLQSKFAMAAKNKEAVTGTLRMGITELVAVTVLPDLVAKIRETYPLLVIEPVVDSVLSLYKRLEDKSLDLVIGPRIYKDDRWTSTLLQKVDQVWLCHPRLIEGNKPVPLSRFKDLPLLLQSGGSALSSMIRRLLDENDVRPTSVISCNGMMALAEMAASGLGVTCAPKDYFAPEIAAGLLRVVETTPPIPSLQYAIATRRDAIDNFGSAISELIIPICDFTSKKRHLLPKLKRQMKKVDA